MKGYAVSLLPPVPYRAGFVGSGESQRLFYFGCCDCDGGRDPGGPRLIAGVVLSEPVANGSGAVEWSKVTLVRVEPGPCGFAPAVYCEPCWARFCRDHELGAMREDHEGVMAGTPAGADWLAANPDAGIA